MIISLCLQSPSAASVKPCSAKTRSPLDVKGLQRRTGGWMQLKLTFLEWQPKLSATTVNLFISNAIWILMINNKLEWKPDSKGSRISLSVTGQSESRFSFTFTSASLKCLFVCVCVCCMTDGPLCSQVDKCISGTSQKNSTDFSAGFPTETKSGSTIVIPAVFSWQGQTWAASKGEEPAECHSNQTLHCTEWNTVVSAAVGLG